MSLTVVEKHPWIEGQRGEGLLRGLVLNIPAKPLEEKLTAKGLITIATAGNVLRMLPPLTISKNHINKAVRIIKKACVEI
jgi:acetylornithine/succinyldiaminopimelate/putrescine aminotransferase